MSEGLEKEENNEDNGHHVTSAKRCLLQYPNSTVKDQKAPTQTHCLMRKGTKLKSIWEGCTSLDSIKTA